ncbi:MAG: GTP cyclohydrolase [Flavobacteriaceae bacterium]|nr:GTP cyclohydrolase [Flavobacteriaceae bacterium]
MKSSIIIKEVISEKDLKDFVQFPFSLYKNHPYWVGPIIKEELETLNKKKNPVFQNAIANYFLAYKNGLIVGRIAVIINWIEVNEIKKSKVRFGWFDFIDDLNVSKKLLEKVVLIGKKNNLKHIEGPVGFSNMDKAGILIKGFDELNTMITLYNYPYYSEHLKKLGYQKLAQWVEYEIKISSFEKSPEKIRKFSKLILDRYSLKILNFKSNKEILPYVDQMFDLLGKTYNELQTFVPIQPYQINYYKEKYFRYIHPEFIKCVVDNENNLIAFLITMPSFSKALKKINGKLFPFGFFRILWAQKFIKKVSLYLIGVRPDYQNKGAIAIIMNELQKTFNKYNINVVETNPELEENTPIQTLWKNYEHRLHKKRATFTKSIE